MIIYYNATLQLFRWLFRPMGLLFSNRSQLLLYEINTIKKTHWGKIKKFKSYETYLNNRNLMIKSIDSQCCIKRKRVSPRLSTNMGVLIEFLVFSSLFILQLWTFLSELNYQDLWITIKWFRDKKDDHLIQDV